jgi:hypothetical protein
MRVRAEEHMSQILFKKAMNIKVEKIISQITDEEIADEIEVLTTLDLIEEGAKKHKETAEDPDVENLLKFETDIGILMKLRELEDDIKVKLVNKMINTNWVNRCEEIDNENAVWTRHEDETFDYYKRMNINMEMQIIQSDLLFEIKIYTIYENTWYDEIMKKTCRDEIFKQIQYMSSTLEELAEEKLLVAQREVTFEFLAIVTQATKQWEQIFENDNRVVIDDQSWYEFIKLKPTIDAGDGWMTVNGKKKFRGYNHGKKFKLNMVSWYKLMKVSSLINFVSNINKSRNNPLYFNLMMKLKIDGKV